MQKVPFSPNRYALRDNKMYKVNLKSTDFEFFIYGTSAILGIPQKEFVCFFLLNEEQNGNLAHGKHCKKAHSFII